MEPVPDGWMPPDEVNDMLGNPIWWTDWGDLQPFRAGASTIYDPQYDRMFIEPRPGVFHDEMYKKLVGKSAIPKLGGVLSPGAAMLTGGGNWVGDIPTVAEGLQSQLRRQTRISAASEGSQTELGWVYNHAAVMHMVDVPPETEVRVSYRGRGRTATEDVTMGDLYRELRFENKLPDKKVTYDRE